MSIPQKLESTWNALYNEVVAVHARWIIYRQLFAQSQERLDILNETAAAFFYVVQNALIDDVQLTLSRLADPALTFAHANATLQFLTNELDALNDASLSAELAPLLSSYLATCGQIKVRRNQQIAHYDHATLLARYGHGSASVTGPSRQEIEDALAALRAYMNAVERRLTGDAETAFQHFISRDDGESLLAVIKQGLRYQDLVKDRKIPWDDFRTSNRFPH